MSMKLSRPEIETGSAFAELELMLCRDDLSSFTTSVDLLEVHCQSKPNVAWNKNLSHESLIQRIDSIRVSYRKSTSYYLLNLTISGRRPGNGFYRPNFANLVSTRCHDL